MKTNKKTVLQILAMVLGFATLVGPVQAEERKPQAAEKAAIVNGASIDRAELDGELLKIQRNLLGYGKPLSSSQVAAIQTEVLEGLVRRELLYQESKKSGIQVEQAAITKELEAVKKQFNTTADYSAELQRMGLNEDALRSRLAQNLAIQQYVEQQFAKNVSISDKDTATFYESNKESFKQPLQVAVSHILVQVDPSWADSRKKEARRKAETILKSLKKGKEFATLAREQSDGPTRTNGGELGYVKMGQLDKPLEATVFKLKPGKISEIVETSYGFHLFKVTDKKPEAVLTYEESKEKIRQFLVSEKIKQELDLRAKSLREKANVEILLKDEKKS